ncbi:sulfotransferase 2A6-like [Ornithodoros turicata]|uniref:sulfotransferase 2A6-like n=1 Tax=Ornithodoros turicata TaxID=34597 RepID=UPI003139F421
MSVAACKKGPLVGEDHAMPGKRKVPSCFKHQGIPIPKIIPPQSIESATKYRPSHEDVFIVTYPKCGTTWIRYIIYLIQHQGVPPTSPKQFFEHSSFIDLLGVNCVDKLKRPGAFVTHLPFCLVPYCPYSKYVVVIKNPRDVIVTLHYQWHAYLEYDYRGTFKESLRCFLNGDGDYGDYFEFCKRWYERRDDDNVLFIVYEDLKRCPEREVIRVATFLDEKYRDSLLSCNGEILQKIVKFGTEEHAKNATLYNDFVHAELESVPVKGLRALTSTLKKKKLFNKVNNARRYVEGDWKDHSSELHIQMLNERLRTEFGKRQLSKWWPEEDFMS